MGLCGTKEAPVSAPGKDRFIEGLRLGSIPGSKRQSIAQLLLLGNTLSEKEVLAECENASTAEVQTTYTQLSHAETPASVALYKGLGRSLVSRAEPLLAADILDAGMKVYPADKELRQLYALALARGGSPRQALAVLDELVANGYFNDDLGGLQARCFKDMAVREQDPDVRIGFLRQAYDIYMDAFIRSKRRSYYTGINSATMALLCGEVEEATNLAAEVERLCLKELRKVSPSRFRNTPKQDSADGILRFPKSQRNVEGEKKANPKAMYWILATLGEAAAIQGHFHRAVSFYKEAVACCDTKDGDYQKIASTKRQLRLLLDHVNLDTADSKLTVFHGIFRLPQLAVFLTADMHPNLLPTLEAEKDLRSQIRKILEEQDIHAGYATPTTFADIIFLEEMQQRGFTTFVTLPISKDAHLEACRNRLSHLESLVWQWLKGSMESEERPGLPAYENPDYLSLFARLKRVLSSASRVDIANDMSTEFSMTNRHYCSLTTSGLAIMKAKAMGSQLVRIYARPRLLQCLEGPAELERTDSAPSPAQPLVAAASLPHIAASSSAPRHFDFASNPAASPSAPLPSGSSLRALFSLFSESSEKSQEDQGSLDATSLATPHGEVVQSQLSSRMSTLPEGNEFSSGNSLSKASDTLSPKQMDLKDSKIALMLQEGAQGAGAGVPAAVEEEKEGPRNVREAVRAVEEAAHRRGFPTNPRSQATRGGDAASTATTTADAPLPRKQSKALKRIHTASKGKKGASPPIVSPAAARLFSITPAAVEQWMLQDTPFVPVSVDCSLVAVDNFPLQHVFVSGSDSVLDSAKAAEVRAPQKAPAHLAESKQAPLSTRTTPAAATSGTPSSASSRLSSLKRKPSAANTLLRLPVVAAAAAAVGRALHRARAKLKEEKETRRSLGPPSSEPRVRPLTKKRSKTELEVTLREEAEEEAAAGGGRMPAAPLTGRRSSLGIQVSSSLSRNLPGQIASPSGPLSSRSGQYISGVSRSALHSPGLHNTYSRASLATPSLKRQPTGFDLAAPEIQRIRRLSRAKLGTSALQGATIPRTTTFSQHGAGPMAASSSTSNLAMVQSKSVGIQPLLNTHTFSRKLANQWNPALDTGSSTESKHSESSKKRGSLSKYRDHMGSGHAYAFGSFHDTDGHSDMLGEDGDAPGPMDLVDEAPTRQVIMAILFADIVGYSKLGETQVFAFMNQFLGAVAAIINELPQRKQPKVRNTWGDAFYFVFSQCEDAGYFALLLSDLVTRVPWEQFGLPPDLSIRVSLHAAPLYAIRDPVIQQRNYTGTHTSRAARIEPITPPGCVYCSQAFAAMSETFGVDVYECGYVGNVPLAKKYGVIPVYHVQWANTLIRPKVAQVIQDATALKMRPTEEQ